MGRRTLLAALLAIGLFGTAQAAQLEESIVGLRIDSMILTETTPALMDERGTRIFIPVAETAESLELFVRVDDARLVIDGWIGEETNRFSVDGTKGEITIAGATRPLDKGLLRLHDGQLYADISLFPMIWPLKATFIPRSSQVAFDPLKPFPIQERLQREARRSKIQKFRRPVAQTEPMEPAYGFVGIPAADLSLTYDRSEKGSTTKGYTLQAAGDLALTSYDLTMTGSSSETGSSLLDQFRFVMGRSNADPTAFGLPVTQLLAGDVIAQPIPLVTPGRVERGLFVSDAPLSYNPEFDRATISGNAPAGWEAELYQDEQIIAFQSIGSDGRYAFENVRMTPGRNNFRVQLYGPQGQKDERSHVYMLQDGFMAPGTSATTMSVTQPGHQLEDFLGLGRPPSPSSGPAYMLRHDRGLTQRLSASAFLTRAPLLEDVKRVQERLPINDAGLDPRDKDPEEPERFTRLDDYAGLSLRGTFFGSFMRLDGIATRGGRAYDGSLATDLGPLGLNVGHTIFDGFESAVVGIADRRIEQRTSLQMQASVPPLLFIPRTMVRFSGEREEVATGAATDTASGSLGFRLLDYQVSNYLAWSRQTDPFGSGRDQMQGASEVSLRKSDFQLAANMTYEVTDQVTPQVYGLTMTTSSIGAVGRLVDDDFKFLDNWQAAARITYDAGQSDTAVAFGLYRQFETFGLAMQARHSAVGVSVGMTVTSSFGHSPAKGFRMSSKPLSQTGFVEALAFMDADGDGKRGPDEEPLQKVRFRVGGQAKDGLSGPDGKAFLQVEPNTPTLIGVDDGSLENPFWKSVGTRPVILQPAGSASVEIPVAETAEMEGMVVIAGDADSPDPRMRKERALAKVIVELVMPDGETRQVVSSPRGLFNFEGLPYGKYVVRIPPGQSYGKSKLGAAPKEIILSADDPSAYDFKIMTFRIDP